VSRAEVAPVIPLRAPPSSEDELARVRRAVDLPRLIAAGYDPGGQVFRPPPEHPVFGYELCPVAECGAAREWDVVCRACRTRFERFGGTLEEFVAVPRVFTHDGRAAQRLCLVCRATGHERPAGNRNGLCICCEGSRRRHGQTVDAVAEGRVESLLDELAIEGSYRGGLYRQLRAPVELLLADPERELARDVWRLAILRPGGGGQQIDYTPITQPWLRELVKQRNRQRLISHSVGSLRASVHFAAELSRVLALRVDRGDDPSALGRQDTVDFLAHLRARELSGEAPNNRATASAFAGCGRCCARRVSVGSTGRRDRRLGSRTSSRSMTPTARARRCATPRASPSGRCRRS
jgi:hypothetical protein